MAAYCALSVRKLYPVLPETRLGPVWPTDTNGHVILRVTAGPNNVSAVAATPLVGIRTDKYSGEEVS